MPTIPVPTQPPYTIGIHPGGLGELGPAMVAVGLGAKSRRILVVSNPVIWRHYGDRILTSLIGAAFEPMHLLLPPGERYKNAKALHKIYDAALAHNLERSSVMLALGGGVVGDMTGLAAATWLRGLPLVQVPTSLLAMVDAAIGGKTAINHPRGKNLIGAFHQPRLVWVDPHVLRTLPPREFRTAMAEVIKYGVIWDRALFALLEELPRLDSMRYLPAEALVGILTRCAQTKAQVVSQDEKEGGVRAILNYGHTLGHAIEAATQYRRFTHGEAVALGMVGAGAIAQSLGFWSAAENQRQNALIAKAKLPLTLPADVDHGAIVQALTKDKKVESGKVRFILPRALGEVFLTDGVPEALIRQVLTQNLT
jgi:3-dehydroquinate synthase